MLTVRWLDVSSEFERGPWSAPEAWWWGSCSATRYPQRSPAGFLPADGRGRRRGPDTGASSPSWPPQSGTAEPAGVSSARRPRTHSPRGNKRRRTAALLQTETVEASALQSTNDNSIYTFPGEHFTVLVEMMQRLTASRMKIDSYTWWFKSVEMLNEARFSQGLEFIWMCGWAAVQKNTVKPAAIEIRCACIRMTTVIKGTTQKGRAFRALFFWTPRTEI